MNQRDAVFYEKIVELVICKLPKYMEFLSKEKKFKRKVEEVIENSRELRHKLKKKMGWPARSYY